MKKKPIRGKTYTEIGSTPCQRPTQVVVRRKEYRRVDVGYVFVCSIVYWIWLNCLVCLVKKWGGGINQVLNSQGMNTNA